jgi:hypothetical protein
VLPSYKRISAAERIDFQSKNIQNPVLGWFRFPYIVDEEIMLVNVNLHTRRAAIELE